MQDPDLTKGTPPKLDAHTTARRESDSQELFGSDQGSGDNPQNDQYLEDPAQQAYDQGLELTSPEEDESTWDSSG